MAWFEHKGSRIYYEDEGKGEAAVLLPGWAGSIEEFSLLREALRQRYRVIAADPPGSGRSGPQPRQYTATYYNDDAQSFLALLDHLGVQSAHLMGFSDGGEYSLLMATLAPKRARSVVTWGAAGQLAAPPELLDAFFNLVDSPIEGMEDFASYLKTTYGEANARAMTQSLATACRAIVEAGGDISRSRAGEISCPVLLMTGEHDFFAPPALVSELAAEIKDARFVEVEGAEHEVHAAQPEWLVATVVEWLAQR